MSSGTSYQLLVLALCVANSVTQLETYRWFPWLQKDRCSDIAIIGAGPAGTYAAWRLRQQGLKINLYEYSNRIGGRYLTAQLPNIPDVNIDYGGMRFVPETHRLLTAAINALGLEIVDFVERFGVPSRTAYYFRGVNLRSRDFGTPAVPYNMRPEEQNSSTLLTDLLEKLTGVRKVTYENAFQLETFDGVKLYNQSFKTALKKVASTEAITFLRDTAAFWTNYIEDVSAADGFMGLFSFPEGFTVKTVKKGMDAIPKGLVEEFLKASNSHNFVPNRQLLAIRKRWSCLYELTFRKTVTNADITTPITGDGSTETICAGKVILAVSAPALERIDWPVFRHDPIVKEYLKSVVNNEASKIFLGYNTPWWRNLPETTSHARSDEPFRQAYDFGQSNQSTRAVLLASYTDSVSVAIWRDLFHTGEPIPGSLPGNNKVTKSMRDELHVELAEAFGIKTSDIPRSISGAAKFWDKEDLRFGCGWTYWRPGYNWNVVRRKMLRPSRDEDVYVVGSTFAFADKQGWGEGALETVDELLGTYFDYSATFRRLLRQF